MTSEKVMLTLLALLFVGCAGQDQPTAEPLVGPYLSTQVWAVLPLTNESGSLQVDGTRVADQLARQFQTASNIDVMPVNRSIEALEALQMDYPRGERDAARLLALLNADGLVFGTVSDFDPYDPPKMGLILQLFVQPGGDAAVRSDVDIRKLSRAATDGGVNVSPRDAPIGASVVAAYFDAANPRVRDELKQYAVRRGDKDWPPTQGVIDSIVAPEKDENWRRYIISMDLFTEFVGHAMAKRLLGAEARRLTPIATYGSEPTADATASP